ncbi:hypothetical protein VMCG_04961 [Cytospora schulzeri]|uniref:CFEM domain-containing protein n=1 Tax=Cytospora schulzeri TaxID=448051 RepID=A0A423WMH1_9PEZI|nr:hypothetical protein VMCG_04961 [Valsa malicola]
MLYSIFSTAVFAGLTVAQYASLPSCAQDCATSQFSGGSYGDCGTDPKCICADPDFIGTISCCLLDACDADDQQAAISFAQQMCAANGVKVQSTASCSTTAATATAASGTAATAASSAASSADAATATGTATGTGSVAGTSAAATGTGTGTAAAGTAASSAASQAWAPRQTAAMGVEFLGGLAAVAGLAFL